MAGVIGNAPIFLKEKRYTGKAKLVLDVKERS